jgi:hypothetical protein
VVNVEYESLSPSLRARGLWSSLEGMIVLFPRVSESYMVYFEDFVHNFIHNNLYYIVWHMLTLFFLFRVVQPLGVLICMLGFISISAAYLPTYYTLQFPAIPAATEGWVWRGLTGTMAGMAGAGTIPGGTRLAGVGPLTTAANAPPSWMSGVTIKTFALCTKCILSAPMVDSNLPGGLI